MKNTFTLLGKSALGMLIAATLCVTACSKQKENEIITDPPTNAGTSKIDSTGVTKGVAEGSSERGANDDDLIANSSFPIEVKIALNGPDVTITPANTTGVTITQTGGDVVINSTATGVAFTVSGTTTDGSIKVYSEKKYLLTLNGANITNADGPAINLQSSKRAFIMLSDGTTNTIADGATYTASGKEDQKGTFFAEGQLIFGGKGTLNITGNNKHGLVSDDYIRIINGTINITKAVSDGIHTNNAFIADGGTLKITSGTDGIETEKGYIIINDGLINTTCGGEGIKASYTGSDATIVPYININGGAIYITSTAGEGIASKNILTINDGNIKITSPDDALNAEAAIYINGGNVYAKSSTNDAIDSNGTFTLTGGKVLAIGAGTPDGAIDCDDRLFKITGGQLLGIGGATSGPTAQASTVRSAILGSGTKQIIHIEAADGTEALTFDAPQAFSTLIFASGKLKANTTYTVWTGGTVSAASALSSSTTGKNFNGWYTDGIYNRAVKTTATFTTNNMVTQIGGNLSTK